MFGLTPLGVFHTLVGLIGVVCGVIALARDKQISPRTRLGRVYLLGTLIAAVSALGIFRRGAFGPAHVLALLTIAALALGTLAARSAPACAPALRRPPSRPRSPRRTEDSASPTDAPRWRT